MQLRRDRPEGLLRAVAVGLVIVVVLGGLGLYFLIAQDSVVGSVCFVLLAVFNLVFFRYQRRRWAEHRNSTRPRG